MALLKKSKIGSKLMTIISVVVVLAVFVPLVSAYEAHTINVTARVKQPLRPVKEQVIECLSLYVDESHLFNNAIEKLNRSLDPELWIDDDHLDCQHGHKVFNCERYAVKRLMHVLRDFTLDKCRGIAELTLEYLYYDTDPDITVTVDNGTVTDSGFGVYAITPEEGQEKLPADTKVYINGDLNAEINTSGSQPIDIDDVYGAFGVLANNYYDDLPTLGAPVSDEAVDCIQWSIDVLVAVDRALAQTLINEVEVMVHDPFQLAIAYQELAEGDACRDAYEPDVAIKHYKKAWKHACHAVEY